MPAFLEDPRALPWLRRAATAVLLLGFLACAGKAGSGPADPTLLPEGQTQGPPTSAPPPGSELVQRTPLPGFDDVVVEVTTVDGQVVTWCLLLADTPERRQRGLMTVADPELGGYDGMLFRFDGPSEAGFWMRNTPLPLSIAYVAEDGRLVSLARMDPCDDSPDCPSYPPAGPYRWAIEVPAAAGGVASLGFGDGAVFRDVAQPCSD